MTYSFLKYLFANSGHSIRKSYFLVRWFLIGKNHCDLPEWSQIRLILYLSHKVLWIFISTCICYTVYSFVLKGL